MECHVSAENAELKKKAKDAEDQAEYWRKQYHQRSDMNINWVEDWSAKLHSMKIDGISLEAQLTCLVKRDEEAIRILIEIQTVLLEMSPVNRLNLVGDQNLKMMHRFLDKVENG